MERKTVFDGFTTPYGTFPFEEVKLEDYKPAFEKGFALHNAEIKNIENNPEAPDFKNTIEAFERSGSYLTLVQSVFYNLLSAESTPEMQDLANEISPIETEHYNNIYLSEKLSSRIKTVYNNGFEGLDEEQKMLLEKIMRAFEDKGSNLSQEKKREFRELSKQLSAIRLKYGQNLLNATNAYEMQLSEEELTGLPENAKEAASLRAKEKGIDGYIIDLKGPSYLSFMKYAQNRSLREKLYRAYNSRSSFGEYDNKENVRNLANIRLKIANLLGYKDYSSYVLRNRMAKNKNAVYSLLDELYIASVEPTKKEIKELSDFAKKIEGDQFDLMPWDWSYYSEKLRLEKYDLDDEMTRPYFELENVKKGVFGLANALYGLQFKRNVQIQVYHPEVEAYEVFDEDGSFLAVFYADYFPRAGKEGGAWMTEYKCQCNDENGKRVAPHISIVMNLTRPTQTKPSLLSIDELTTFLHEFGHALHGMLSKVKYETLAGTNVYRDFVELPSQIMENWATEKEYLDSFATHYQTGENIPENLIEKIKNATNYHAAYFMMRQLSFGYLDMGWHTIESLLPENEDIKDLEQKYWLKTQFFPVIDGTMMSTQFSHIFDGGYSAGYYSYKWAEVLDADAFAFFKKQGIFNRSIANRFRHEILEKGGSVDPLVLYCNFRGEKPKTLYLLKRCGIV